MPTWSLYPGSDHVGFRARQTARCGSSVRTGAWLVPSYIDNRTCFGRLALPAALAGSDSATQPDSSQPSYLRHPALGQPVGRCRGRHPVLPGQGQDPLGGAEDLLGLRPRPLEVEAFKLVGDLDHAARVDDVVGRVPDAVIGEQLVDAGVGKLVVGAAADDPGAERGGH